jgi:hypothetical protein
MIRLNEGETIIKEGKANRARFALISQGGKLILTNQRLVFVGHGMNIGEGTVAIKLADILRYKKAVALPLIPIPNAFKITDQNGKTHKFIVSGRGKWIRAISQAL